jgi:2-iminobutanoate/2-iminopropanoate deaminase
MKQAIDVGLPPLKQPFSWAIKTGNMQSASMLFTTHAAVRPDGSICTGDAAEQTRITLHNVRAAVQAAGGSMDDVTQVLVYLTDVGDMPAIDAVYREFFTPPYPNRSSAVVGLVVSGMRVEMVVTAVISES